MWIKTIGQSKTDQITSVKETSDGGIIALLTFNGTLTLENGQTIETNGYTDILIIKYTSSGEIEFVRKIGGADSDYINSVDETIDNGYVIGGYFYSTEIELGNGKILSKVIGNSNSPGYGVDGMIIKLNKNGDIEWGKSIGGTSYEYIRDVISTSDNGCIAIAEAQGQDVSIDENTLLKRYESGIIIKYNSNGEVEWYSSLPANKSIEEISEGEYLVGGIFTGITKLNNKGVIGADSDDGLVLKIKTKFEASDTQELIVENQRKQFKISTAVKEIDGIKGGSISGEYAQTYETVKYGDNSTKNITMTPDENYEIISVTVNGKDYPFTADEYGTYTMPQFENVTEDKQVVVTYSLKDNKITINKIDSQTGESLTGAKFKIDQLEEREDIDESQIIGDLTANGNTYNVPDMENNVTESVLGELTNNGTYYFVQNEEGKLIPTNGKTYQIANGGTSGI